MIARVALALTISALVGVQVVLHRNVGRLTTEYESEKKRMYRLDYMAVAPDGAVCHFLQHHDETAAEFAARAKRGVLAGDPGTIKTSQWTDANGVIHIVSLARDPAWTEAEWCERFDNAVEKFQEAFPCD